MNDTNKRLFFTIALCLGVAYVWTLLFAPKPQAGGSSGVAISETAQQPGAPAGGPSVPAAPAGAENVPRGTSAPGTGAGAGPAVPATPRPPARELTLRSDKLQIVVGSDGAVLKSVQLQGLKFRKPAEKGKPAVQVELVAPLTRVLPLSTEVRAAGTTAPILAADAPYEVVRSDEHSAVLRATAGGITLTKTYALDPATYRLNVGLELHSNAAFSGRLTVIEGAHGEPPPSGMFSSRATPAQTICQSGGKLERLAVGAKTPTWEGPGAVSFAGIDEQYFLNALVFDPRLAASCRLETEAGGALTTSVSMPISLASEGTTTIDLKNFLGPKDTDELSAVAPPLAEAVDFGFWSVICNFLLVVMKTFYKLVPPHNWGVAIILLTLSIKLVTFPLQHRSMKSMQEMQRIQPQLEELKKKYAGDQQRQNLEQMKLFKEHGVNPMGSCLPMLIQMPVWLALYKTLGVSVELYNSVFIGGWLNDLTAPDPYYALPLAMGITMVATQVLTPTPMQNPSQKTIGYVMSGFFSLIMFNTPSGLTLYIFVNNLLSIAQQVYLRRTMRPPGPRDPEVVTGKARKGAPASEQVVPVSAKRV